MRLLTRFGLFATLLAILLPPNPAYGHRDLSLPLYVAADGTDAGRCQDAAAPCRSIGYALSQAGKGAQIKLAAGRYAIARSEDLFLLLNGSVNLLGGYDRASGFVLRSTQPSILTGVPERYRPALRARGLQVIADTKADNSPLAVATAGHLALQTTLQKGNQPGPCVDGVVDNLPCDNVDLVTHIPFADVSAAPQAGNDVWGFTDLNSGREYVLAGFNIGTAVFDVTDAERPREVGFIDGQNASWRDIKVHQFFNGSSGRWHAYAYVTTDGSSDGLFVIDLGGLPHAVRRVAYTSQFSRAHNVYGTSTDFSTGLSLTESPHLIIAGSNLDVGQYRAYALTDPAAPQFVAGSEIPDTLADSDPSYMHDAASLLLTDSRKDTQCVNAATYCELLLDFNEEMFAVWDITDVLDPQHLNAGDPEYAQRGYVHSGWWSEDRQFVFVHDELDEQQQNLATTLRIFSLADLRDPQLAGTWTGPTTAIDHNGFVRGNRYYMSNYKRGLTILDITTPADPALAGYLDTYPFADNGGFAGAWGVFPFLPSGTLAISDINSGIYLARDRSRATAAGQFALAAGTYASEEGQQTQITVTRNDGHSGAASVSLEVVHGTAGEDDYTLTTQTLSWGDGDTNAQSFTLAATADGSAEDLELLLLRLVNPTGGATLADRNTAWLHISDAGAASSIELLEDTIEIAERGFGTAVVVLGRRGSALGAVSVDYSMTAGNATAGDDFSGATSGTVSWADGDAAPHWIEFAISDDGIGEDNEFFELTLSNPDGATLTGSAKVQVTILDATGANLAPNAIAGMSDAVSENSVVTLDGSASNDPNDDPLTFQWLQLGGPSVSLTNADAAVATFTAPSVASDTLLSFQLTVTDPGGLADSATVEIVVANVAAAPSDGGSGGGSAAGLLLLLLLATAGRRLIRKDAA